MVLQEMQNIASRLDRSTNMTQYEVTFHVRSGFIGILYNRWDSLDGQIQIAILDRGINGLVNAIAKEFIGRWMDLKANAKEKFLNAKLYDLNKFDQYVCKMQEWYYNSGDIHNPSMKVRYVESFHDVIKAKYKASLLGEDTTSMFFARINQIFKEVHRQIYQKKNSYKRQKEWQKYFGNQFCKNVLEEESMFGCVPFPITKHYKCKKKNIKRKNLKGFIRKRKKRSFKNLLEEIFLEKEVNLPLTLNVLFSKESIMQRTILKEKIVSL